MEKKQLILIKEGAAEIYVHSADKDSIPSKSMQVFYNEKMELNRDVTNLAVIAFSELYNQDPLIVVDSMAASGISAIRMLKECDNIKKIFINDVNSLAIDLIKINISNNNLDNSGTEIEISRKDANFLFSEIAQDSYIHPEKEIHKPHIISIDPFGTPNRYIDSAFKAIRSVNGLMCITATDTAVLFGIRPSTCIRKYMAKSLHVNFSKEIGARILIHFIFRIANINGMGIVPLLTFYAHHFIRVFCLTFKNKEQISEAFKNLGYIFYCSNCDYRWVQHDNLLQIYQNCPLCKSSKKIDYAGPLWLGDLHNNIFIDKMIAQNEHFGYKNTKKIFKLLTLAKEEIDMPVSYYNIHKLCQKFNLPYVPKLNDVIHIIKKKGYKVSRTHFDYLSIKTNMDLKAIKNCLLKLKK